MNLNGDHLIRMPIDDSKSNHLAGFWRWVEILANGDFKLGIESLFWDDGAFWTSEQLEDRITTFFGGDDPWSVVIPNERLIGVINDAVDHQPRIDNERGWFMAQIPVTTKPDDPKDDKIPLMGLAVSFFVREHDGNHVLQYEIFHV